MWVISRYPSGSKANNLYNICSVQNTSSYTNKNPIHALKINCTRHITLPFLSMNPTEKGLPGGIVMRPRDPNRLAGF